MLRDYQIELAELAAEKLADLKIVYLAIEMRVGKTLIALQASELLNAKNVLFVTKKAAISSIIKDFENENFNFILTVINYEQLKNYTNEQYDVVIVDESHLLGQFPKPALRTSILKSIVKDNYLLLLSGTPSPESYSQLFHQFWISQNSPFKKYRNFYYWARDYVDVGILNFKGLTVHDYSRAKRDKIMSVLNEYMITYTREEAGFEIAEVEETIVPVLIDAKIYNLIKILLKDRYFKFSDETEIIADMPVKLQTKIHQLYSGTVITEDGSSKVLDLSKANYIKDNYKDKHIAIFYKFKAERDALMTVLKKEATEDVDEFNTKKKRIFISQIQSGSMGTDLSSADVLIFYNIDFSAVQYWQARARLQTLTRTKKAIVHWLFAADGIEFKIYKAVIQKKNYTMKYFEKDYAIRNTI